MVIEKPPNRIAPTVDFAGNEHLVVRTNAFQTKCTSVKCLMVKPAQRQSVCYRVRSASRHPLDMCSLHTDQVISESHVEVADGTSVLIFAQHTAPESWVAPADRRLSNFPCVRNTSGDADFIVQRLWKM